MVVKLKYKAGEFCVRESIEEELHRYEHDNYLWAKHVCNVELNPHQLVWMNAFDSNKSCLLVGSRRIRKSFCVAVWYLKQAATRPGSEINIHSPSLEQSKGNLKYMTDIVLDSEILREYLERRLGEGIGREYIEFQNHSIIRAKGQASSVDGLGATHQWWEELDDMDREVLLTRIFPTGSEIKGNYDYKGVDGCHRIATGTIKGKGNIFWLENPDRGSSLHFKVLPKLDCYDGIAMGIIPKSDIDMARVHMTPAQFARTYLVLYTESNDYFPTRFLNLCHGHELSPCKILRSSKYPAVGKIAFGMDFEGRGETKTSSRSGMTFVEMLDDGQVNWLYSKEWELGTLPKVVVEDVCNAVRYFQPDRGIGDSYGYNLIYDINKELFKRKIIKQNVDNYENKSGVNGWDKWFLRPVHFSGQEQHKMYSKTQNLILNGKFKAPVIIPDHPRYLTLQKLFDQLENIKATMTKAGYDSFGCVRKALGDDLVDTLVGGIYALSEVVPKVHAFGGSVRMSQFFQKQRFAPKIFRRSSGE